MGQRRAHHGRVLKQRVGVLLLEALRRERDVGLRHLPVVDGPAIAGHRRRRGEGVARLRELTSESEGRETAGSGSDTFRGYRSDEENNAEYKAMGHVFVVETNPKRWTRAQLKLIF